MRKRERDNMAFPTFPNAERLCEDVEPWVALYNAFSVKGYFPQLGLLMPIDTIIDFPCRVKKDLGHGDMRAGTKVLAELVRARERCEAARARASKTRLTDDSPIRVVRTLPTGVQVERTATIGEIEAENAVLNAHVPVCTNCPVNALRRPFGCIAAVAYPITKPAERWLIDRVEPPDAIGGALCLQNIADAAIDGERTREYRTSGLFQAFPGLDRDLPSNRFDKSEITGDELFQPLLLANDKIVPWQALHVLLWFGAVKLDDAIPKTAEDATKLTRLEPADRAKRAKLYLGTPEADAGIDQLRNLLKTLFVAWVRDVEILIDT